MKMKCRFYLKVGKRNGKNPLIKVSMKPDSKSLDNGAIYNPKYYPTALIGIDLDIPDSLFDEIDAKLEMKIKQSIPCVEIRQVESEVIEEDKEGEKK